MIMYVVPRLTPPSRVALGATKQKQWECSTYDPVKGIVAVVDVVVLLSWLLWFGLV